MANEKSGDDQVGYGRPPSQTRFREGQSGNPKGRPRGARNLATLLGQALAERVVVTENGRRRKLTKLAAACKQLVNRALAGDLRAMKLLLGTHPRDGEQSPAAAAGGWRADRRGRS